MPAQLPSISTPTYRDPSHSAQALESCRAAWAMEQSPHYAPEDRPTAWRIVSRTVTVTDWQPV